MTGISSVDVVLVLEQTLGNTVHGENLARVTAASGNRTRVVRLGYDDSVWRRQVPVLGNWTLEASIRARRAVSQHLHMRTPDAMFVHTQCAAQGLVPFMGRIPTVVSMDATPANLDTVGETYGHHVSSPRVEAVKAHVTRRALRRAAVVTTWSHWAAASVVEDYGVHPERVRVVRPGARLDRFAPLSGPRRPGPVRLLFVGGDLERKGGPELFEAVRSLGGSVELDVVTAAGPGDVPPGVRVHTGLSHGDALMRLYRDADVFVVPTRGDAYGIVFAEAMACGLPVVATLMGAVPEIVEDGRTGLLVPPRSPAELARALRALVDDPALRERLGRAGLARAHAEHDAELNCGRLVDLMHDVASARARTGAPNGRSAGLAR